MDTDADAWALCDKCVAKVHSDVLSLKMDALLRLMFAVQHMVGALASALVVTLQDEWQGLKFRVASTLVQNGIWCFLP